MFSLSGAQYREREKRGEERREMEETIALATETNGSKTSFFLISSLYDEILLMSG